MWLVWQSEWMCWNLELIKISTRRLRLEHRSRNVIRHWCWQWWWSMDTVVCTFSDATGYCSNWARQWARPICTWGLSVLKMHTAFFRSMLDVCEDHDDVLSPAAAACDNTNNRPNITASSSTAAVVDSDNTAALVDKLKHEITRVQSLVTPNTASDVEVLLPLLQSIGLKTEQDLQCNCCCLPLPASPSYTQKWRHQSSADNNRKTSTCRDARLQTCSSWSASGRVATTSQTASCSGC